MPSPFPGMDPYLEDATLWRGLHEGLIYCINALLNASLPPGYAANIDERLYVVQPGRDIYPDVAVVTRPPVASSAPVPAGVGGGAAAVAVRPDVEDVPLLLTVFPEEVAESFVEVRLVGREQERVVSVIEVLSPANKSLGADGRESYLRKQRDVLRSDVHLLEIDLLRRGAHTAGVPEAALRGQRARWDYLLCLHRGGRGPSFELWPLGVRERLPRVRVPLAGDEPDLILDLQTAFDRVYDEGPYRRRVDYRAEPDPPLASDDAAWANQLLRQAGLRP